MSLNLWFMSPPPIHPLPPSNPGLSSLDAVEQSNFQRYMCSKLLLVHGVWLSLYWSFSHTQFAQVLVPFLVKTRFEQQSIFFLPSYSSSVFYSIKYCNLSKYCSSSEHCSFSEYCIWYHRIFPCNMYQYNWRSGMKTG